mgnify:CR=1 FL=1
MTSERDAERAAACKCCGGTGMERWVGYGNNEEVGPCSCCAGDDSMWRARDLLEQERHAAGVRMAVDNPIFNPAVRAIADAERAAGLRRMVAFDEELGLLDDGVGVRPNVESIIARLEPGNMQEAINALRWFDEHFERGNHIKEERDGG